MPEIGATLREARMRAKIDITEVEHATKIRAKYLRALENEEWSLLPGPTFIKSFLREYADHLGLDARLLVEEYKLRYERPSEQELAPISPNLGGRDRRGGGGAGGGPVPPRWAVGGALVVLLLVVLFIIGSGDDEPATRGATTAAPSATTPRTTPARTRRPAPPPTRTTVRIVPTGTVYVCLVDQAGRLLIAGETLAAGQPVPVQRARAMRLTLGNNQVQLTVNGRAVPVPASATAIAYALTPDGVRTLPEDQAPTCTA